MTPVEILREARKLIENPGAWTQCAYARDDNGKGLVETAQEAVCFCASGAIWRAGANAPMRQIIAARSPLESLIGTGLVPWNDAPERTHPEVLAAFDKAIALAEKEWTAQ